MFIKKVYPAFILFFFGILLISCSKKSNENYPDETMIGRIKGLDSSGQVIIVTASKLNTIKTYFQAFEKGDNGEWKKVFPVMNSIIGRNGFAENKKERDGCSPMGIFGLNLAYGNKDNPGTKMPYRKTNANDFWVDDENSEYYNSWMAGPADGRWKSAEPLNELYDYSVVIDFNKIREKGKGSAIFFHTWDKTGEGTYGCVGLPTKDFLNVLKWLDPSKKPVIVLGTMENIQKFCIK